MSAKIAFSLHHVRPPLAAIYVSDSVAILNVEGYRNESAKIIRTALPPYIKQSDWSVMSY